MNPNEFGKKLGIGVRVAGRIAQQRAQEAAQRNAQAQNAANPPQQQSQHPIKSAPTIDYNEKAREIGKKSHKMTRAAGRGVGGFLRPFGRVGGILWLEVTGFFFGLFTIWFAQDLWRARLSYAAGPDHGRFLMDAVLIAIFGYLSSSAFWRARRK